MTTSLKKLLLKWLQPTSNKTVSTVDPRGCPLTRAASFQMGEGFTSPGGTGVQNRDPMVLLSGAKLE
ncbi:hypothetical protein PLUA15_160114 [Pseudomonas lundensis]|uniref:Uncharacterized protein n=1 Tax=Pseudomonas lundensis TaxID=86185 RepID=A0AAX2H365_9PSED|nr:hypothetical protein PLUA15_160114 [Pseudomonas lundensis]